MKKILGSIIVVAFMLALPIVALAHDALNPYVTPLIANGGSAATAVQVGVVKIWNAGAYLYVKYEITADLTPGDPSDDGVPTLIYETHLAVATSLAGIPQSKGNPMPGQFKPYSTVHSPGVAHYTYMLPSQSAGTLLYIAAHAVVKKLGGLAGLELALPPAATISVQYPYTGGPSYFPNVYVTNDGTLNGTYLGWCIDTDLVIYQYTPYLANVYSSYEALPPTLPIEQPGNLDLVNWVLNQNYVGQVSPNGYGTYTYGDVQLAIWTLIENQLSTSGLGPYDQNRVNEIVAAAYTYGEGYLPPCGGKVAVILAPVSATQIIIAQMIIADVEVPCNTSSETAWGSGPFFSGKNWATYIEYYAQ